MTKSESIEEATQETQPRPRKMGKKMPEPIDSGSVEGSDHGLSRIWDDRSAVAPTGTLSISNVM